MRDPGRLDPERWRRLLRKVAEQEPLPRHVERQRLGRTPLGHGPQRLARSLPGAGNRAPIAAGAEGGAERAEKGEDQPGRGGDRKVGKDALEGAGQLGSPQPARTALAAAEARPDVGEQAPNGGYSNLRTNVRSHNRAGQAEQLVGGGLLSALPSVPAAGSAHPRGRRGSRGGWLKGLVQFPAEGVTLFLQGWERCKLRAS